ncbi:accessory factor UbiK family protein [Pelagibius litoralis]|uniref:Accessory factor UbiK family protein n=1 Tax=Pelagibius litoralis TaxID=374515 RepID=A0A967KCX7_9PROT|nr:accessory factor UbiK family protein [Pelagibius litoralis]NIA71937.1 accessory factor UbiK family protein [Pelagibius litoralis]
MQSQNKILDDMARVASSAMGVAAGMRGEVEARVREQLERLLAQMDLVSREDFEVIKAVAVAAREEQEALSAKLAALEARLAALEGTQPGGGAAKAAKRPAKAGKGAPEDAG